MAMSRGRAVAGDPELVDRVSAILDRIVAMPRDRAKLASDVAAMRGRIEREKVAANVFDVKLSRGGLIDCEFAAQFLVLAGLGRAAGETTAETLRRAEGGGVLREEEGRQLLASTVLQTALLQVMRTAEERTFDPERAPDALKRLMITFAETALRSDDPDVPVEIASFDALGQRLVAVQDRTRTALETLLAVAVG
jgi:glutamate-ammonia-ligase adenylyltransferase